MLASRLLIFHIFVVAVLALMVWMFFQRSVDKKDVIPKSIGIFDSRLGWTLRPSANATSTRTGHEVVYEIDQAGRRLMDNQGSDSRCRIVAVGDSNTFGFGISMDDHWLTVLRRELPKLEVFNLGVQGYGVDQELIRLESEGLKLKPVLTIAYVKHFHESRHLYASRFGALKPYFTIDSDDNLVLHSGHVQANGDPDKFKEAIHTDNPEQVMRLGVRIIKRMKFATEQAGGNFLLVAGWKHLCESVYPVPCLFGRLDGTDLITPDGENLRHLSHSANQQLGLLLSDYLKNHPLLPKYCLGR